MDRVSRAPVTITDLPDELLLAILQCLPGIDLTSVVPGINLTNFLLGLNRNRTKFQLSTLISLSRVNRHFHGLVAAELYATYNSHFCEPYLFLRSIVSNADLARHVRHVDITYGEKAYRQCKRYVANAQDKKAIKDGLRASGIADWKTLASLCNTDRVELENIYAAIIMQTPKISSMIIDAGWLWSYGESGNPDWVNLFKKANSRASSGLKHKFEHLRSLTVENSNLRLSQLAPALRTPSLRKLSLKGLVEHEYGDRNTEQTLQKLIPCRCNSIEELYLKQSLLKNNILALVVGASQHLKVFSYDMSLDNTGEEFYDNDLGSMTPVEALESQSHSLESLTFLKDIRATEDLPRTFDLRRSLRSFSSLTYLKCQLESIVVDDFLAASLPERLPPALRALHVSLDDGNPFDPLLGLKHLATGYTIHNPVLEEVRLMPLSIHRGYHAYDYPGTTALFARTEVRLIYQANVDFDGDWSPHRTTAWGVHAVPDDEVSSESSGEISLYSDD